ncbi:MAG: radical SAM protein [Candidatus Diapherotrites archaeon]|nr:radical SAM protein [Candidatus Diapherotrites archaeon]
MRLNKFFEHRLPNGKTALISSFGDYSIVGKTEAGLIRKGKISGGLQKKLERDFIAVSEKNKQALAERIRKRYSHVFEGVTLHIVNPTMRCNHACQYCYAQSLPLGGKCKGSDLGKETALKIIDFIWQSPGREIVMEFQGGEPLANFPAIEFIVEESKKRTGKNVHFRIVTNLTLMDNDIARFLQRNKIFDVCTSLDGPKSVHDKNRRLLGGSSYEKVVYWINALKSEFGFRHIGMLPTITRHSLNFPREIVDEYRRHGMADIIPVMLRPIGRAKQNWKKIGYQAEDYIRFWRAVADYCIKLSREGKPMAEQYSLITMRKILGAGGIAHTCFSKPCGAGLMQASYQPNGSIFTCDEAKSEPLFKIGDVSQGYREVFTSPAVLNMVALSSTWGFLCNECKWSPYCWFCPVLAYSGSGNPLPMLPLDMDCAVKKAQISFVFEKLFSKDKGILLQWLGSQAPAQAKN